MIVTVKENVKKVHIQLKYIHDEPLSEMDMHAFIK